MKRALFTLALACSASAQRSPAVAINMRGYLSGNLPMRTGHPSGWNRLQPGQSAAIGPESSGHPAKQGAPVERVEASRPRWWRVHLADTALHVGATSADAVSSWGRPELHPLLRSSDGRFGARGLAVKAGLCGAVELVKWRLAKRRPQDRWVRSLSLGPAVAFGSVAARNWRLR